MDYKNLNNMLNSLEVDDQNSKNLNEKSKTNLTQLERDINLNNKSIMNLELVNPQRQFMNNNKESDTDTMNSKINNYNFIPTKKFNEDMRVNFKQ